MASGGGAVPSRELDVSIRALGPQGTQEPPSSRQQPYNKVPGAEWHKLGASLKKIGRDLVEEEDRTLRVEMHRVFDVAMCQLKECGSFSEPSREAIGRQLK